MSRERIRIRTHVNETSTYSEDDSRDESDWSDYDDDLEPSDSASAGPARHHRPESRARQKVTQRPTSGYAYRRAPDTSDSLDTTDYSYEYGGRGAGYAPPLGPAYYGGGGRGHQPPYPQSHVGGGYPQQQMVPFGPPGYPNQNPFAPMNGANGGNYFNPDHRPGWGDVMPHGAQPFFNYPLPHSMQQYQWHPPPPPPTEVDRPKTPAKPQPPPVDPEKEAMKKKLAEIEAEAKKREEEAKRAELEKRIREEAERTFQQKMEQLRKIEEIKAQERKAALEKAKKDIEDARKDAERAAREAVEKERAAEAERAKREAEAIAVAERKARDKLEAERKAEEERKKKEAEAAAAAELAARLKLEAAIKKEAEAKAAAEKKAKEELEWRKNLEEEAKLKAEIEARKKVEDEKKKAEEEKAAAEAKKKEDEAFKKKALEEAKVKAEEARAKALGKDKAPIRFKDAVGRKFSFPFHVCQSWAGMEELIKQAFAHVDGIGNQVQAGHYDLIGPNGEIILPGIWEKVIEPDWSVSMNMWPMGERPPIPMRPHMGAGGPIPNLPQGRFPPNVRPMGHHQGVPAGMHHRIPVPPPMGQRPVVGPSGGRVAGGPPHIINVPHHPPERHARKPSKPNKTVLSWFGGKPVKSGSHKRRPK